jgi:hypothetical protein
LASGAGAGSGSGAGSGAGLFADGRSSKSPIADAPSCCERAEENLCERHSVKRESLGPTRDAEGQGQGAVRGCHPGRGPDVRRPPAAGACRSKPPPPSHRRSNKSQPNNPPPHPVPPHPPNRRPSSGV